MFKRIILFGLTNLLVVLTISLVLNLLGVGHYISTYGIDYSSLMVFCLVWGMGGAFISLAMSRLMAKWMMGVKVINPNASGEYGDLVSTVHDLARQAGLPAMPEVGVYESLEVNAFATGPTKSRSLVAVSSGLLNRMSRSEIEGVLGHEIAHIANGDMVTMTLIQGVINAFVMFFAKIIAFALSQNVKAESRRMVFFITEIVLQIALSILGYMVVAWFSRQREFRADAGGARFAGRAKMIGALQALQSFSGRVPEEADRAGLATMKISGKPSKFFALMSTHPPLETRIARLQSA